MECCREDLLSIVPFLPLILRSSTVYWPPSILKAFKSLSRGSVHSNVNSGQTLALAIEDLRISLGLPSLHPSASFGCSLFFDDLMDTDESDTWFKEVVPRLADLLLRLPALLETHYKNVCLFKGMETGLRLLEPQHRGIVFLSQELIAALLVCALFCLFPTTNRGATHLPPINFDNLFVCLHECYDVKQENKMKCIIHYFEKICSHIPAGNVSFERKVLPLKDSEPNIVYPEAAFWSKSTKSLCKLEVHTSGLIEDQSSEALEVDFANMYIGGGALGRGCVQEEIRFMINPELIVSMLFMPSMADNEAIEIIGVERFSKYSGYASSFRFCGDHEDRKGVDSFGRRRTRIVAIDALCNPGKRQYRLQYLVRETNKAFCGFFEQHINQTRSKNDNIVTIDNPSVSFHNEGHEREVEIVGVATGNWGCGAFGGDPQVKVVVQWMAASEALRPFVLYYTFGLGELEKLEVVVEWILSHKWTVGELWNMLVEYSTQRLKGETSVGFFDWLLPSLNDDDDPMMWDAT